MSHCPKVTNVWTQFHADVYSSARHLFRGRRSRFASRGRVDGRRSVPHDGTAAALRFPLEPPPAWIWPAFLASEKAFPCLSCQLFVAGLELELVIAVRWCVGWRRVAELVFEAEVLGDAGEDGAEALGGGDGEDVSAGGVGEALE